MEANVDNKTVDLTLLASSTDEEEESEDEPEQVYPSFYKLLCIGNPQPKPAPRFNYKFKGFKPNTKQPIIQTWTRNEMSKEMKDFRTVTMEQLQEQIGTGGSFPIYKKKSTVNIKIWFCRRPPDKCFTNGDRTRPKGALLRSMENSTPHSIHICPDTDNMLKFVLDSLKTVAWHDDNQVGGITAYKCHDCHPPFEGRTVVILSKGSLVKPVPEWGRANNK